MVMGLMPIFLLAFLRDPPPLSSHLAALFLLPVLRVRGAAAVPGPG